MFGRFQIGSKGYRASRPQALIGRQWIAAAVCAETLRKIDLVAVPGLNVLLHALERSLVSRSALLSFEGRCESEFAGFLRGAIQPAQ